MVTDYGLKEVSPKVVTVQREGYTVLFWFQPNLTRYPAIKSCYVNLHRNLYLVDALHQLLNQTFSGFKTQQPVETYPRHQYLKQIFKDRIIQNGDTRDNKKLPTGRGGGYLHRFQRRILPYTNSKSFQEVHAFSNPGSVLPVQSSPIWYVHRTHGVYSNGEGGQNDCLTKGYKNPPVPRRLVGQSQISSNLSAAYTYTGSSLPGIRLVDHRNQNWTPSKSSIL